MAPYFMKTIAFGGKIINCNKIWRQNKLEQHFNAKIMAIMATLSL